MTKATTIRRVAGAALLALLLAACDSSGRFGAATGEGAPMSQARGIVASFGGDQLTIELWVKVAATAEPAGECTPDGDVLATHVGELDGFFYIRQQRWVLGLAADGDVWFGLRRGTVADGVADVVADPTCTDLGGGGVRDGEWHHVAVQRALDGRVGIWVDGQLAVTGTGESGDTGPMLDGGYRTLTIGGPPAVAGQVLKTYNTTERFEGQIDEVRLSTTFRYPATSFTPATERFSPDAQTFGLWQFNGTIANAELPTDSRCRTGGFDVGPERCIRNLAVGSGHPGHLAVGAGAGASPLSGDSPFSD